jgi:hypothetical protein
MKKSNSIVASFRNKHASTQGVEISKDIHQHDSFLKEESSIQYRRIYNTKSPIESSKGFKFALVVCYAFLISILGSVVYIANLLDPKFPF